MASEREKLRERFQALFLPKVKGVFGNNLSSVTLYGSAVIGQWTDRVSDLNTLLILKEADPSSVTELGKRASRIMKKNRINPLLLTESEYLGSADVFPMEYLDIRAAHEVVYGDDLTPRLEITNDNLRHQIEEQLRGSVTALRRVLLETKGNDQRLRRVLNSWFGSQNALFRALLRLKGATEVPSDPSEVIASLAGSYSVDGNPVGALVELRSGKKRIAATSAHSVLGFLVELTARVDSMDASI